MESIFGSDCKGKLVNYTAEPGVIKLTPEIELSEGSISYLGTNLGGSQIVSTVSTLDAEHILYLFGPGWNDVVISCRAHLGNSESTKANISKPLEYYNDNKVDEGGKKIQLSVGSEARDLYLVGVRLGGINHDFNYLDFELQCKEEPEK